MTFEEFEQIMLKYAFGVFVFPNLESGRRFWIVYKQDTIAKEHTLSEALEAAIQVVEQDGEV